MSTFSLYMLSFVYCFWLILFTVNVESSYSNSYNLTNSNKEGIEWLKKYHKLELLPISSQMEYNSNKLSEFRANLEGVIFSGVFTDYVVLQRQPQFSSLYGTCDTSNTLITLSMRDESTKQNTLYNTKSMNNGDWKVKLPKTYPNGGNFTFTVTCTNCKSNKSDQIYNVTFGDVIFCAGQSNMQLELHWTFSKNYTYDNITKLGKYRNIRFFTSTTRSVSEPTYVYPKDYQKYPMYVWNEANQTSINTLDMFSAACFYTAQMLSDNHGMSNINFGLIDTAVGGTMIESWTMNHTIDKYCSETGCPGPECGGLYNGNVMPWINMTIKAALWYQGENNVFEGSGGNWNNNTGYSCMEKLMLKQWRANFSVVPKTTPSNLPFGLVTLAAGTSEGHQPNMSLFRWAQSLNYDLLPSLTGDMANTFMITAHDIGDPWYSGCGNNCQNPAAPYAANESDGNGTNWFMGPIHPRPKIFVGERMARVVAKFVYNIDQIYTGPVITGCSLNTNNKQIAITFNKTLMYGEQLFYQQFQAWYNSTLTVNYQTSIQLNNGGKWEYIDDKYVSVDNSNGPSVILDISSFYNGTNQNIVGIRYAWEDYPCCGDLNVKQNPCPMDMCPFQTQKTRLPALPFWAQIINGKCKCFEPQICDQ